MSYDEVFEQGIEKKLEEAKNKPFDKEEWKRQKQADREKANELIKSMIESMRSDPGSIKTFLDVQNRFPRMSARNALLIAAQMPQATELADYKEWKKQNAFFKKGVSGILIMEMGGEYTKPDGSKAKIINAKRVYDVSQTTLKRPVVLPKKWDYSLLIKGLIKQSEWPFVLDNKGGLESNAVAHFDKDSATIYIERGHEGNVLFQGMARELAHAMLAKASGDVYNRKRSEPVAECASYMVCSRAGIDGVSTDFKSVSDILSVLDDRTAIEYLSKARDIANNICLNAEILVEKACEGSTEIDAR